MEEKAKIHGGFTEFAVPALPPNPPHLVRTPPSSPNSLRVTAQSPL